MPHQSLTSTNPGTEAPAHPASRLWLPFVGLAAVLLCLPFLRVNYTLTDEGILLHAADRMLRGDRLYADFFEFLPPGGFVLTAAWLKLAGISFLSARILVTSLIAGIACFVFLACLRASRNSPLSAFLAVIWVVMSQGEWTQVSHHWFTTFFSMIACWAALVSIEVAQTRLRWPLIAGAAAGMAAMVTPTRGALTCLAALSTFLNPPLGRSRLVAYVAACAVAPVALVAYLVGQDAFVAAFNDVIIFAATRYASIQALPFGSWSTDQNILFKYLYPVVAVLFILVCARDWRASIRDPLLRLTAAFSLAGLIGSFPRPHIGHIFFGAPLALPLLAMCLTRLNAGWHPVFRKVFAILLIGLCVYPTIVYGVRARGALLSEATVTPRGKVKFLDGRNSPDLLARIEVLPPYDAYLFYPYSPLLPFLLARHHVADIDIFIPGYTLPSQYRDACESAMRRATWAVIDRVASNPAVWQYVFPAMDDPHPPETREFEKALESGFELIARIGVYELRRRRADVGESVCSGIE